MNDNFSKFDVVISNVEKYSDTLSKGRCRIFYKYDNRNRSYITDEFAEHLISTIPYTPVKGIYEGDDYTDHGEARDEGRIYGIVPERPNFAWETHVDEDGVEREYAAVDVLLFTAIYKESSEIIGKALSMELYPPSLKGEWKRIDNEEYYVFEEGCFLGLQVLGDDVEPCFEGAGFFSLQIDFKEILKQIQEYSKDDSEGLLGGKEMPEDNNVVFRLSDDEKLEKIFKLLNPSFNEEGGWKLEYSVTKVYDSYALAFNYAEDAYERIYYTKDDEKDVVELGEKEQCFIMDVTEVEKNVLDTIYKMNNNSFEKLDENYLEISQKNTAFEQKIEEQEELISTLNVEKDGALNQLNEAEQKIEALEADNNDLREFKRQVEKEAKTQILDEYSSKLSKEIIENYTNNLDNYSVIDLDKELAYEAKKSGALFTSTEQGYLIPKDQTVTGLEAILDKYEKK